MKQALDSIKEDGAWWQVRLWDALDDHHLTPEEVEALSKWVDTIYEDIAQDAITEMR